MTTIYKLDSKGKVRLINFSTEANTLLMESGLLDGNLVMNTKVCKGKNIGKANETTPEDQALAEMMSRITKKLDEGYFKSIEEAKTTKVVKPMLAKPYSDREHKIDWSTGVYVQRKFDGMRCLVIIKNGVVNLQSRDGKDIMISKQGSMQHIIEQLSKLDDIIIDGELMMPDSTFQGTMKAINSVNENNTKVNLYLYDIVSPLDFSTRFLELGRLATKYDVSNIKLAKTYRVEDKERLLKLHKQFVSEGYEGSIVRHGTSGYEMKRSDSLLKFKDFFDIKAKIIDVVPGEQKSEWGVPYLECIKTENGVNAGTKFSAGMRMTHEEKTDLLTNKQNYIGKVCEIRFFETTDDGLPRFPVLTGFID